MTSLFLHTDLQLWVCGDYAITDSAYQLHSEYNATCQPACMDSSSSLSLPTQYYWAPSDWGACSAACDGGVQTRTVACMNSIDASCAPHNSACTEAWLTYSHHGLAPVDHPLQNS